MSCTVETPMLCSSWARKRATGSGVACWMESVSTNHVKISASLSLAAFSLRSDGRRLAESPGNLCVRTPALRAEISRSEEHTSELQSRGHLVCRLLLEKKKN